jgi:hypothetical protein
LLFFSKTRIFFVLLKPQKQAILCVWRDFCLTPYFATFVLFGGLFAYDFRGLRAVLWWARIISRV